MAGPRLTVRRLMLAVAGLAVLLHATATASRVRFSPECRWIRHVWERADAPEDGARRTTITSCVAPFWAQYWRRLLGRPWPGTFRCPDTFRHAELGIGGGTECRPHRYVSSYAVPREEVWKLEATRQSLKSIRLVEGGSGGPVGPAR